MRSLSWVFLGVLLAPAAASAYVRTTSGDNGGGIPIAWPTRKLHYLLNQEGDRVPGDVDNSLDAVRRSFAAWTQPSCTDLQISEDVPMTARIDVGTALHPTSGKPQINLVVWRDKVCGSGDDPNQTNCWEYDSNAIAMTTPTFRTDTGEIVGADMEVNGSGPFQFTTTDTNVQIDVQNTVTHEAGHFIGLAHSPNTDATMYWSAPSGETSKRTLSQDDIEGVCYIYPTGAPTPDLAAPASASSGCDGCTSVPAAAMPFLALALGAGLGRYGRRERRR